MADNLKVNPGSCPDAEVLAADDVNGVKHLRFKIQTGQDGVAVDVSDSNPLPVSGATFEIQVPFTVDLAAYSIGDSVGGKIQIQNVNRANGEGVILTDVLIVDRSNQKPTGTLFLFASDPTEAAITDQAAFVSGDADARLTAVVVVVTADYKTVGTKAFANLRNLFTLLKPSVRDLWLAFVADGAPDFVAATDLAMTFKFMYA